MQTWYPAASPVTLGAGPSGADPVTIVADVGGGSVQIQFKDQAGAWFTPSDESYTLSADGPYHLDRSNCPPVRIFASSDAQFQIWGLSPEFFEGE